MSDCSICNDEHDRLIVCKTCGEEFHEDCCGDFENCDDCLTDIESQVKT
jgi:hypothetical protein